MKFTAIDETSRKAKTATPVRTAAYDALSARRNMRRALSGDIPNAERRVHDLTGKAIYQYPDDRAKSFMRLKSAGSNRRIALAASRRGDTATADLWKGLANKVITRSRTKTSL